MEMWIILFTAVISLFYGRINAGVDLPEVLQPFKLTSTSTCYGDNTRFQPSCSDNGTVIAIRELTVGAKLNTTTCPSQVQLLVTGKLDDFNGNEVNESICCFQDDSDCTFEYDGNQHSDPPFKHFLSCSGRKECSNSAETVRSSTTVSGNCGDGYTEETSYMYMQHYCINETKIGDMCGTVSETIVGSAFYVQSPDYPSNISSTHTHCNCSVQSSICGDTINVYTVHVHMTSDDGATCRQNLSVSGPGNVLEWDCSSETMYNITKNAIMDNYIVVELYNTLTSNGGYVWLGFEANRNDTELVISCPAVPESACTSTTTSSPGGGDSSVGGISIGIIAGVIAGVLILLAATKLICSPGDDSSGGGISIGIIAGVIAGVLILLVATILICCCCICKKKKNKVDPDEEKRDPEEEDIDFMESSLRFTEHSAPPANTHFFRTTPIPAPSLRVSETPYIMEHSGVNNITTDEGGKNTNTDDDDWHRPPAHLPPIIFHKQSDGEKPSLNGHLQSHDSDQGETAGSNDVPKPGRLEPLTTRDVQASVSIVNPTMSNADAEKGEEEGEKKRKKKKKKHRKKSRKRDSELDDMEDEVHNGGNELPSNEGGVGLDFTPVVPNSNAESGEGEGKKKKKKHRKKSKKRDAEKRDTQDEVCDRDAAFHDKEGEIDGESNV